uniref:Cytochrome c domain-containing protein n=1 Tax=Globodera pallida TaxID=36090 RepID=A0A183CRT8_GLOPA
MNELNEEWRVNYGSVDGRCGFCHSAGLFRIDHGFDMAKGIELPTIYGSGYLVISLSTLISLLIVAKRHI